MLAHCEAREPTHSPFGCQEDDDSAAAEDEVRRAFLRIVGLVQDHTAVDYRPAVVIRSTKTELAERGVLEHIDKLAVQSGGVQLEITGRFGSTGGIFGKPEEWRRGRSRVAGLLADPAPILAERVAPEHGDI